MGHETGNTFSVQATTGGAKTSMEAYGICFQRGNEWAFVPEPLTETLNIPGMAGGYVYYNEVVPTEKVLSLVCKKDSVDNLLTALDSFAAALPVGANKRIWIDGITNRYWVGRRISGIKGEPVAQCALEFEVTLMLDDPRPCNATTNARIG